MSARRPPLPEVLVAAVLLSQSDISRLEGAKILSVDRRNGNVYLVLALPDEHVRLECIEVGRESTLMYGAGNTPTSSREPEFPLDLIERVESDAESVTFSGCRRNMPWHVWKIKAVAVRISRGTP